MRDLQATSADIRVTGLDALRNRNDPAAVKAVAKEMEAMFAYEMIKVMRETVHSDSKNDFGSGTYTSMFDMQLSRLFAERGIGLQDSLVKGLNALNKTQPHAASSVSPETELRKLRSEITTMLPEATSAQVSSGYGERRDPFSGAERFHHGVDVAAPAGVEIHAVQKGTVTFSGELPGYGNVVIVDHGNGFQSKYAHNQSNIVKAGDGVDAGTVIARVGSSGRSTGPHVHFEVMYRGESVDPAALTAQG